MSDAPKRTEDSTMPEKTGINPLAAAGAPPDKPVAELTPEEQMALYEKDLRENDWGHQPC